MSSSKAGFSLLELIVAVAIMGIALTVIVNGFGLNLRSLSVSEGYMQANTLLRKLAFEAEQEGTYSVGEFSGDFGEAYPEYRYLKRVSTGEGGEGRRVHLTVLFERQGVTRDVSVSLFLTDVSRDSAEKMPQQ